MYVPYAPFTYLIFASFNARQQPFSTIYFAQNEDHCRSVWYSCYTVEEIEFRIKLAFWSEMPDFVFRVKRTEYGTYFTYPKCFKTLLHTSYLHLSAYVNNPSQQSISPKIDK